MTLRRQMDALRRAIQVTAPVDLGRTEHVTDPDGSRWVRIYGPVIGGKRGVVILPERRPLDVPKASPAAEEP